MNDNERNTLSVIEPAPQPLDVTLEHLTGRRLFFLQGSALFVTACGGGGNDSSVAPAPAPALALAPAPAPAPAPSPAAVPVIKALSSVTPTALTPLSITTAGVDTSKPYSVTLKKTSSTGSIVLVTIRSDANGLIVVGLPLSIDTATGKTSDFVGTVTVTQNGVESSPFGLTVKDIPTLAELGVPLGVITRSFYLHQQISMAATLNGFQSMAALPGTKIDTTAMRGRLANQIQKSIYASSDVDRIMVNNSVSVKSGTTSSGLTVGYDKNSLELQDRVLAVYLLAYTGTPVASGALTRPQELSFQQPQAIPPGVILGLTNGLVAGATWSSYKNQQQANLDGTKLDRILATATFAQSALLFGSSVVAVGAAVAGAPVLAAAAGGAATIFAITGAMLAAASVGNDLYNVATHTYDAFTAKTDAEQSAAKAEALKALGVLGVDATLGVLQAEGLGLFSSTSKSIAGTVFESIFAPVAKDVVNGFGQFATSVGGLYINGALGADGKTATESMKELPSMTSATGIGFMDGVVTITNNQGPILSGLTGVGVGPGALNQFSSIADQNGNYTVMVPYGNPAINYSGLSAKAYDPVTGDVLNTSPVNLSTMNSKNPVKGPHLSGVCSDTDAGNPDSDDPDCD